VDPRSFKDQDEFVGAYKTAWALAQACDQIIGLTEKLIQESEGLTKKERGEVKDLLREAIS
jgi:hypothetical protein